jgi:hypothetical protein
MNDDGVPGNVVDGGHRPTFHGCCKKRSDDRRNSSSWRIAGGAKEREMRSTCRRFPIIASVLFALASGLSCGIVGAAEFVTNLKLGTQVDLGVGKAKITKISEAIKTPINSISPKNPGHKFVIIETTVTSLKDGSTLSSGGFVLLARTGLRLEKPGAYGKVRVFGNLSNFEATEGAVVTVGGVGDSLNVFFEVPENTETKDLRLLYVVPAP